MQDKIYVFEINSQSNQSLSMTGSLLLGSKAKAKAKAAEEDIVMAEAGSLTSDSSDHPASDATPPSRFFIQKYLSRAHLMAIFFTNVMGLHLHDVSLST